MTAKISEISEALANSLTLIPGLRVVQYIPDQLNPPVAYVAIDSVTYHRAFGGGDATHEYTVTVIVGRANERTAQGQLDDFLSYDGTRSVRAAIELDKTLGAIVQTLIVTGGGNISPVSIGDNVYISVEFNISIHP